MKFLYAAINFLILLGLVLFFGRKTIVNLFETRRKRINEALSETEAIEKEKPDFPKEEDKTVLSPKELAKNEISEIESSLKSKIEYIRNMEEEMRLERRREMISDVHKQAVVNIRTRAEKMFRSEPYASMLRNMEEDRVMRILSELRLTPGDIAYLKTHDVLYVTLTSAFPLPEDLVEKIGDYTDEMLHRVNGKTSFWVRQDPSLIGGFSLRIGDTLYDCTVVEQLYQLERKLERNCVSGSESAEELISGLMDNIGKMSENKIYIYQVGRVLTISDGICWMDGLADIMYGEVVEFACGNRGMVLDIQPSRIGCVIYGDYEHIESGSRVRRVGKIATVPVGEELLGRVVNAVGHAIDGKGRIRTDSKRPVECSAPAILDRAPVCQPFHTGIKAIDSLVPIGKGQRELIIGDRQTGKSAIAVDTIINQKGKGVVCIYVAIGQKDTTIADIRAKLEKAGAMNYTTIVCANASASAALQYIAPFAGTAMGEYFMYSGRDVLIVYDDLSKHAVAYRELSLLLHRPSGREAYPGDIFYLHSRLLERSAKLCNELGGGSMTAIPIIETLAGDISSYIPTNVISITDGQIFLDTELFHEGQRPAVNVGLSVSRVGGAAQTGCMKQVSASLRMKLAQYRELAGFSQFGTDVDEDTQKSLDLGLHIMNALKQERYAPLPDFRQVVLIYAVSEGYANGVAVEDMEKFERNLYHYIEEKYPDLQSKIATGIKMDDGTTGELKSALKAFVEERLWLDSNN